MFKYFKRKKRIAQIEARLDVLKDVYMYYKVLIEFNRKLMAENVKDMDGFDRLVKAESKALTTMFSVENEIERLEKELRKLTLK